MQALILVATSGGPTMFARIGIMRALNRQVERVFNPDRKDHHWGRRKLSWRGINDAGRQWAAGPCHQSFGLYALADQAVDARHVNMICVPDRG